MRVSWPILGSVLLSVAPACSTIWGFQESTLGTADGGPGSSGVIGSSSGASGSSSGDATVEEPGPDASTPIPDGCLDRLLTPDDAVFVDPSGNDAATCGVNDPCQSWNVALGHAAGKHVLYVGIGDYKESVVFPAALLGLGFRIEGRWQRGDAGWTQACAPDDDSSLAGARDPATFRIAGTPPGDAGTRDDAGPSTDGGSALDLVLASVSLKGADVVANRSSYALFATDASFEVRGCVLSAGRGGDGAQGDPGPAGNGADGCGDGTVGSPGGPAPAGVFTADGWTDSTEAPALLPGSGKSGVCSNAGCGMKGGNGGQPGFAGKVGGASVTILAWNSPLQLTDQSSLYTTAGGTGGTGGNGGAGAGGVTSLLCGSAGAGGAGGAGAAGSPGAGGPSYCVVLGNGSTVAGTVTCTAGPPGEGGGGNVGLPGDGPRNTFTP